MFPDLENDMQALARPVSPEVRARIEQHVERMIGLFDEIDGDPDLEDCDPLEDGGDTEPNGDERDNNGSEEDRIWYPHVDPKARPMAQEAARNARALRRRLTARRRVTP